MGIFDWKHWVVILAVGVLLFGGKKLRNLGSDLGQAIRGFKTAVAEEPAEQITHDRPLENANVVEKDRIHS